MEKFKKIGALILASMIIATIIPSVTLADNEQIFDKEEGIGIEAINPNILQKDNFDKGDDIITFSSLSNSEIIDGEKVSVSGGTLWAQFRGGSHRAKYDHASKTHRCTATNVAGWQERSAWVQRGYTATSPWISSSLWGNRVFAATK